MIIPSQILGNCLVLSPQGRIDHTHADAFTAALTPHLNQCTADGKPLILDFGNIEYISSVGLRALMLAARQIKEQGGNIAIARLTPIVREVFEISRFNLVYRLFDSVEAALAEWS